MALPILTSDEDVQKIVDYFKTKAMGATVVEAKPILGKYLDHRKVAAYLRWKFLKKDGEKLKLDELGRQLSRTSEEGKKNIYGKVIRQVKPYYACVEYAFHQGYNTITNVEVATFWHEHHSGDVGSNETTIKDAAISFFYICEAAGLGKKTIGRKGGTTRFEFNLSLLGQYIAETGFTHDSEELDFESADFNSTDSAKHSEIVIGTEINGVQVQPKELPVTKTIDEVKHKVFISHSANKDIVDQIKTMLDLAGLEYEVAVDREATAIPVPDKIFSAMRSSTSGIICVTADEKLKNTDDSYAINQNVLIEIGAAFVLYDKKVVLVWDKRLPIPSNLQGLYRCEFQGDELSWSAGMKLMKAVTEFKK